MEEGQLWPSSSDMDVMELTLGVIFLRIVCFSFQFLRGWQVSTSARDIFLNDQNRWSGRGDMAAAIFELSMNALAE